MLKDTSWLVIKRNGHKIKNGSEITLVLMGKSVARFFYETGSFVQLILLKVKGLLISFLKRSKSSVKKKATFTLAQQINFETQLCKATVKRSGLFVNTIVGF